MTAPGERTALKVCAIRLHDSLSLRASGRRFVTDNACRDHSLAACQPAVSSTKQYQPDPEPVSQAQMCLSAAGGWTVVRPHTRTPDPGPLTRNSPCKEHWQWVLAVAVLLARDNAGLVPEQRHR